MQPKPMSPVPRAEGFDQTLAMLREGYAFIGNRCDRYQSDMFSARIMLRRVICVRGADAARMFYCGHRFTRVGAMPPTVLKLLQDFGSVQLLAGDAHRVRKGLFLELGSGPEARRLAEIMTREWERHFKDREAGSANLFDSLREILTRAVLRWAAIPFDEQDVKRRVREFSEMIESTGSIGPRNWRAQFLRARSERWARSVIRAARSAGHPQAAQSPLQRVAWHRDATGERLDVKTAAVELLNVLRPSVAVARFIVFAAKALDENPAARLRIQRRDEAYLAAFVSEVRRLAPFFPYIGGRVREPFAWRDHRFERGDWVLLDIYGTNRHPAAWNRPDSLRPERFLDAVPDSFAFIPQGGGDVAETHRCPGETITTELMKRAAFLLAACMRYDLPPQDLSVDRSRIPAIPASGYRLANIHMVPGRPNIVQSVPAA